MSENKNPTIAPIINKTRTLLAVINKWLWSVQFVIQGVNLKIKTWLVILGVLGACMAVAYVATRNILYASILLGVVVIGGVGVTLNIRMDLAPIWILFAAAFTPISIPTGTSSRLVDSMILTAGFGLLWVIQMFVVNKKIYFIPTPVNIPVIGFMIVVVISLVWGMILRDPILEFHWPNFPLVQTASALSMILLPGAFLLVVNLVDSEKILRIMVLLILIAGAPGLVREALDINFPIVNNAGLFGMWFVSIAFGMVMFDRKLFWVWRIALLGMIGGFVLIRFVMNITWVAGWLPCFVVMGIQTIMRSKRLTLVLGVAVVIILAVNLNYYLNVAGKREVDESGITRLAAAQQNWTITRDHLLFGTGPAGYALYYMSYFPAQAMATHNNYVDILAQTGITGTFFVAWFFIGLGWRGYKISKELKGGRDFKEALANAVFAGTIGCMIMMGFGDWLFPFAFTQTIAGFDHAVYSWLFMGTILVIEKLRNKEKQSRQVPVPYR